MPIDPNNPRLPWQLVLLGFLLFIAALIGLLAVVTSTRLVPIPGHEADAVRTFALQFAVAVAIAAIPLVFFGRRKLRRWRSTPPPLPTGRRQPRPPVLARGTRIVTAFLILLVAFALWVNGKNSLPPRTLQMIFALMLATAALFVAFGGGNTDVD
jgi:drug/metabolite transporter (DMT)-like permease